MQQVEKQRRLGARKGIIHGGNGQRVGSEWSATYNNCPGCHISMTLAQSYVSRYVAISLCFQTTSSVTFRNGKSREGNRESKKEEYEVRE